MTKQADILTEFLDADTIKSLSTFLDKEKGYESSANAIAAAFGFGKGFSKMKDEAVAKLVSSFKNNLTLLVQKTWVDRISEYPNRRTINDGVITKQVTVARDEGTVTEAGDAFNASNMNDLEQRISDAIAQTASVLTPGDNISIASDVISVTGFMTANEAHTIWNNA
jgi:hypothetical protein